MRKLPATICHHHPHHTTRNNPSNSNKSQDLNNSVHNPNSLRDRKHMSNKLNNDLNSKITISHRLHIHRVNNSKELKHSRFWKIMSDSSKPPKTTKSPSKHSKNNSKENSNGLRP